MILSEMSSVVSHEPLGGLLSHVMCLGKKTQLRELANAEDVGARDSRNDDGSGDVEEA